MATTQPIVDVAELGGKTKDQLLDVAESVGLGESSGLTNLRREDLLSRILQTASSHQALTASGILEIMDEGYGFLRQVAYSHTTGDVYISQSYLKTPFLHKGIFKVFTFLSGGVDGTRTRNHWRDRPGF